MVFDNGSFSENVSDPRYDILKKKIKVDKDNKAYEIQFIPPATAIKTFDAPGAGGGNLAHDLVNCWNGDGTNHYIDVYCGADFKANMQGSGLLIRYWAKQGRLTNSGVNAYWGPPIDAASVTTVGSGSSVPWNPLYMFQTISLKINTSQTPIEQYVNQNNLQHISTARFLLKYKSAIENSDSTFMTPCIESNFDGVNDKLSAESCLRAQRWLGAIGDSDDQNGADIVSANSEQILGIQTAAGRIAHKKYTKFIPLSDIFESCETPAIWNNVNRFRLEFTFRSPDQICFQAGTPPDSTVTYFYIDDIKLMFDSTRMQPMQTIETAEQKEKGTVENIGYMENFCVPVPYPVGGGSSQLVVTGQRDVQMVILGFPAINQGGNACVNPLQYGSGGLTSLNLLYGSDMPLRTPLNLDSPGNNAPVNNIYDNVAAYRLYIKACGCDRSPLVAPALTFRTFKFYNLYFFPIYYPALPHRNNDPRDIRLDNVGNQDYTQAVVIVRRFNGAQIMSNGLVEKL